MCRGERSLDTGSLNNFADGIEGCGGRSSLLKGTVSRDSKNYFRVFGAKCVFLAGSLMGLKFLYCLDIFELKTKL